VTSKQSVHQYQQYWDQNIEKWGELYLDISHGRETLVGPAWFCAAYNASIGRLERKLMADRYARTMAFIDTYISPETIFSDLGCGTGIFVVEALRRGAIVNAIDFSPSSLAITRQSVNRYCPGARVNYQQLNVQTDELPASDVTLAMGLTPYLTDLDAFMDRALPSTKLWLCLFVDPEHWANRIRSAFPLLNVRNLQYYNRRDVDRLYAKYRWKLIKRESFATGYIDLASK
jgi:SAM-dependent methyltransferase